MPPERKFQLLYVDSYDVIEGFGDLMGLADGFQITKALSLLVVLKKLIRARRVDGLLVHELSINEIHTPLIPIIGSIPILVIKRAIQDSELSAVYKDLEDRGVRTISRLEYLTKDYDSLQKMLLHYFSHKRE